MLAWPTFAILKHYWPESIICAMVPRYTEEMAQLCPWIDEVLIDNGEGVRQLADKLSTANCNAMLTLYSTSRIAIAGLLAGIPYRLTPATKFFQLIYNHRLVQRRSRSAKPEYAYNIDLAYHLLNSLHGNKLAPTTPDTYNDYLPPVLERPLLHLEDNESSVLRQEIYTKYRLNPDTLLVFIHPGSGGSANNLSAAQYITLANSLSSGRPLACIITAGPGEEKIAEEIATAVKNHPAFALLPRGGLSTLARYLHLADLFISCSTGPLHIAGALDRPTAAFYPRHRSGNPLRWQTLNTPEKRLYFTPPEGASEKNVASIDVQLAASRINQQFFN